MKKNFLLQAYIIIVGFNMSCFLTTEGMNFPQEPNEKNSSAYNNSACTECFPWKRWHKKFLQKEMEMYQKAFQASLERESEVVTQFNTYIKKSN